MALDFVKNFWAWITQAVNQHPGPVLSGLFFVLVIVLVILAVVLFARLRILGTRQRQLQRTLEHQASEAAQVRAYIDSRIQTLLTHQERAIGALSTATQKISQDFPADLVREELASVRTDFLAGKEKNAPSEAADP